VEEEVTNNLTDMAETTTIKRKCRITREIKGTIIIIGRIVEEIIIIEEEIIRGTREIRITIKTKTDNSSNSNYNRDSKLVLRISNQSSSSNNHWCSQNHSSNNQLYSQNHSSNNK